MGSRCKHSAAGVTSRGQRARTRPAAAPCVWGAARAELAWPDPYRCTRDKAFGALEVFPALGHGPRKRDTGNRCS